MFAHGEPLLRKSQAADRRKIITEHKQLILLFTDSVSVNSPIYNLFVTLNQYWLAVLSCTGKKT